MLPKCRSLLPRPSRSEPSEAWDTIPACARGHSCKGDGQTLPVVALNGLKCGLAGAGSRKRLAARPACASGLNSPWRGKWGCEGGAQAGQGHAMAL